ncbi:MAG TPA: hypothetical protein PK619_02130 [bacterium]|nr:hypothetical protein [bacterium]HPN81201.1 hypothetical protein [bacterium]HPW39498.1 hypothetical protein [bacterium]
MLQRTKFKLTVYAVLLVIFLALLIWLAVFNAAQSRDYKRLSDMRLAQAELMDYFLQFNTFVVDECQTGSLLNFCQGRDGYASDLSAIIDPVNEGNFQYVVSDLSADNFRIDFSLEVGAGGLSAGNYALTVAGFGQATGE